MAKKSQRTGLGLSTSASKTSHGSDNVTEQDRLTAASHATVKKLVAEKLRFLVPMTVIFMVGYIGLTVLAAFAKPLMAMKVVGSVNLGFVLIGVNYVLAWILAIVYTRVANSTFDPLAREAAASLTQRKAA